jgi:hypothetical protein
MKKSSLLLFVLSVVWLAGIAQNYNELAGQEGSRVITTAVPFMMIAPDARSGAMGEAGVATEPDANSMHWNPAKYAFIEKDFGFGISYSPWLRRLVNDINLAYLSGFGRIDDMSAVAATLRYFSLGDITFTDEFGNELGTYRPNEFALDATYSRKFSEHISGAVAARFIYSNLTQGQFVQGAETSAGTSIAADVAVYYQKEVDLGNVDGEVRWGINISNIGNKISYSKTAIKRDFIPTNFRIGAGFTVNIDDYNSLSTTLDVNKLLVPTPPVYQRDSLGNPVYDAEGNLVVEKGRNPDVSVVQGMIQSWYDAPYGFSEEMREFSFAFGLEYWYNKIFSVRGGFFYEDATKGNRKFFTVGAGLRYNVFGLDLAYLIPLEQQNPLENTLRFTLLFNFTRSKGESTPSQ